MIFRTLRGRLVAAMALVLLATVAAMSLYARLVLRYEYRRLLLKQGGEPETGVADVEAYYRTHGSWRGVEPILARIYADHGRQTLVLDAQGKVLARYPPEAASYVIDQGAGQGITLTRRSRDPVEVRVRGPVARIRDPDGRPAANVYSLPAEHRMGTSGPATFTASVERWLVVGMAVALLVAFALSATLVRRLLAPLDALASGTRALAAGRLDARVEARGGDEIAEVACSFNAMAEALQRNEATRRRMVSDLAHEIRTPLTSMRARAEAAQDGVLANDAKFLASLHEDLSSLGRLVDDLQQLSLAQAGALRLDLVDVSLEAIVRRVIEAVRPETERRGLALLVDVPGGAVARADADRLVQVLRNLVVNAVSHARGAVRVAVAEGSACIEVRIADDGEGVPPEVADRVFDRFVRADPSRSRATGGTGLGLAIARELIQLQGGAIWLENRPGAGATFVFTVPRT